MKCVGQMPDFAHCSIRQQHLDNVEADFDLRVFEQLQVIQRALGKQPAFARIHGGGGPGPIFGGARLHLDKHEAILVPEDEINFAPIGAEIGREEFKPELLEVRFGCTLTERASLEMRWKFLPAE